MDAPTEAWNAAVTDFWNALTEEQRNYVQGLLDDGWVSPEITNDAGQRAYIDGIQKNSDGTVEIIGQLV